MFGILCESECGIDAFGNPKGKPILMESVGDMMNKHAAIARAEQLKESGKYGNVKVVRLELTEFIIK